MAEVDFKFMKKLIEMDDKNYETEDYPSENNHLRAPPFTPRLTSINIMDIGPSKNGMIDWVFGPDSEAGELKGFCHCEKTYPIILKIHPNAFLNEKENSKFKNVTYFLIFHIGNIYKIDPLLRDMIREGAKIIIVNEQEESQEIRCDFKFASKSKGRSFTSRKSDCIYCMWVQLFASFQDETVFLCESRSQPFCLASHAQQYGYQIRDKCPLCLRKNI